MVLKAIRLVNQGSHIRSRVSLVIRIETINRGPMTIFQDKLLTKTYRDEAGDCAVNSLQT